MNSQIPSKTLNGAFGRYLLAAAITVVISPPIARTVQFAGFVLLAASPEQPVSFTTFIQLIGMTFALVLTFGSVFWVPLLLLAIFPGHDLWKTIFAKLVSKGLGAQLSLVVAALAVIVFVAVIGIAGTTVIIGDDLLASTNFIVGNGWPACLVGPFVIWLLFRRKVGVLA